MGVFPKDLDDNVLSIISSYLTIEDYANIRATTKTFPNNSDIAEITNNPQVGDKRSAEQDLEFVSEMAGEVEADH